MTFTTLLLVALSLATLGHVARIDGGGTFANPVLPAGADPHAIFHDGEYFYIASDTRALTLYRTRDITDLAHARKKVIWTAPDGTDHSRNVWAPEVHVLDGKWYVYVAADDGNSDNHKMFVLENPSADPFAGSFQMKARLKTDPNDNWAIDLTVFQDKGTLYALWSGWATPRVADETACIWIAPMTNPWTIDPTRPRAMLSQPQHDWERKNKNPPEWGPPMPHAIYVNEGPAVLKRGEKVFVTYSASGCWTPTYCLGLLAYDGAGDILDPTSWTKARKPVFVQQPGDKVFGPGHNSFFKSPDGTEDWNFYHANDKANECGGPKRSPRMQRVEWSPDGTPTFGKPVAAGTPLAKPSGTK